jgi:peptidoglycan/xylan/chitin deacetylase (PgdA/CDA1 family)
MAAARAFHAPVIMLYHSIRDGDGGSIYRISISPERFQRHVEFLTRHYRVVPLEEFLEATHSRARLEGMACITFDDGYVDNLGAAREILARFRVTAAIFVPTGYVGRSYFWWDAMHAARIAGMARPDRAAQQLKAMFPFLRLPASIGEPEWFMVWDHMRRQPLDQTYQAVQELAERVRTDLTGLPRPISTHELQRLVHGPFEIGSHAVSHRPLPALPLAEMRAELEASRDYLESLVGKPVRTFSYKRAVEWATPAPSASCATNGYLTPTPSTFRALTGQTAMSKNSQPSCWRWSATTRAPSRFRARARGCETRRLWYNPAVVARQPLARLRTRHPAKTGTSPPCVHSWMLRKSAVDAIGPFDPYMLTYEDQKFLGELSLRFPIYVASTCLCEYRRKDVTLWAAAVASGSDVIAHERFARWVAQVTPRRGPRGPSGQLQRTLGAALGSSSLCVTLIKETCRRRRSAKLVSPAFSPRLHHPSPRCP